ncbi:MAG: hypothetical protein H6Q63_199, partial [Firmicutes bacterium]|nr:hypothetical protein [Bacillota bacterium]
FIDIDAGCSYFYFIDGHPNTRWLGGMLVSKLTEIVN